jgi:hypothetical protein
VTIIADTAGTDIADTAGVSIEDTIVGGIVLFSWWAWQLYEHPLGAS